jgi:4-amino-4-deoxychorismate lyase
MSQFIESIKIEDQEVFLLELHQKRVNATFAHFGMEGSIIWLRLSKT